MGKKIHAFVELNILGPYSLYKYVLVHIYQKFDQYVALYVSCSNTVPENPKCHLKIDSPIDISSKDNLVRSGCLCLYFKSAISSCGLLSVLP